MIIAFAYIPILLFGINPKLLYLIVGTLVFLSVTFLVSNYKTQNVIIVYFVVLLLVLFGFYNINLDLYMEWGAWKESYLKSSLNRIALTTFICLSNAFVISVFVGFLPKRNISRPLILIWNRIVKIYSHLKARYK
jgi:hypothetical protein